MYFYLENKFLKPNKIRKMPTDIFKIEIIVFENNVWVKLPKIDIRVKKNNVEKIHPRVKNFKLFFEISSCAILLENTPAQKTIVSGFESVKNNDWINIFWLLFVFKKFNVGNISIYRVASI